MSAISSSKYNVLKALIALAWADGKLTDAERQAVSRFIDNNRYLTDAERAELKTAMETRSGIDESWTHITDPEDRAALIDLSLTIFHADKDYSAAEQSLLTHLRKTHMASLDLSTLETDIKKMAAESRERLQQEEAAYIEELKKNRRIHIPGIQHIEILFYRIEKKLYGEF